MAELGRGRIERRHGFLTVRRQRLTDAGGGGGCCCCRCGGGGGGGRAGAGRRSGRRFLDDGRSAAGRRRQSRLDFGDERDLHRIARVQFHLLALALGRHALAYSPKKRIVFNRPVFFVSFIVRRDRESFDWLSLGRSAARRPCISKAQ